MSKAKENPAHVLAAELEGSCQTLSDERAQELGFADANAAEEALVDYVFICATCGWWCAADERGADDSCIECDEDNQR